jgi:DNA repair protein RadC
MNGNYIAAAVLALIALSKQRGSLDQNFAVQDNDIDKQLTVAFSSQFDSGFGSRNKSINQLFLSADPSLVSDENLIAILIYGTTGKKNPQEVAKSILDSVQGKLGQLISGSFLSSDFTDSSKAKMIAAAELTRRANYRGFIEGHGSSITNANEMRRAFKEMNLSSGVQENLSILYFNQKREVIGSEVISKGSHRMTLADPAFIIGQALKRNASSFAVAHNHPSGSHDFSDQDKSFTLKLKDAAKCVQIELVDSLVIGKNDVFVSAANQYWFQMH